MAGTSLDIFVRARDEASRVISSIGQTAERAGGAIKSAFTKAGESSTAAASEVGSAWERAATESAAAGEQFSAKFAGASEEASAAGTSAATEVESAWREVGVGAGQPLVASVESASREAAAASETAAAQVRGAWSAGYAGVSAAADASTSTQVADAEASSAAIVAGSEKAAAAGVEAATTVGGAWAAAKSTLHGLFTGAIALGGLTLLTHGAIEYGHQIQALSSAYGISTEEAGKLKAETDLVGVSITSVIPVIARLTKATADSSSSTSLALQKYGVNVDQFRKAGVSEQLQILADAYTRAGDKGKQFLADVLGGRGTKIAPVLAQYDELATAADGIDFPTPSHEDLLAMEKFQLQMQSLVRRIEIDIIPLVVKFRAVVLAALLVWSAKRIWGFAKEVGQALKGVISWVGNLGTNVSKTATRFTSWFKSLPTGVASFAALAVGVLAFEQGLNHLNEVADFVSDTLHDANKEIRETGSASEASAALLKKFNEEADPGIWGEFSQGLASAFTGERTGAEQTADAMNRLAINVAKHRASLATSLGETLGLSKSTAEAVGNFFTGTGRQVQLVQGDLTGLTAALAASTGASDREKQSFASLLGAYQRATGSLAGLNTVELQHLIAEGKIDEATRDVTQSLRGYYGITTDVGAAIADATTTLDAFEQVTGTAIDTTKKQSEALADARSAWIQWRDQAAQSLDFVGGSFQELATKEGQSVAGLQQGLDKQLAQMQTFGRNLKTIARDGGRGAQELVRRLLALGPAGAQMAQKLVDAGKEGRRGIENDLGAGLDLAKQQAGALERALTGGFRKIARAIIIATTPIDQLADKLAALDAGSYHVDLTVETHYESTGSPPIGTPANVHGSQIAAQSGYHGMLSRDTWIHAHAGERVDIGPTNVPGISNLARRGTSSSRDGRLRLLEGHLSLDRSGHAFVRGVAEDVANEMLHEAERR